MWKSSLSTFTSTLIIHQNEKSFCEFCGLCGKHYRKTIKFRRVRQLGMSTCIAKKSCETYSVFKKSFFQAPDTKKGDILKTRNNRLISESKHPLLEQLLRLLSLMQFNGSFPFCALGFCYVDLWNRVSFQNSREIRFHMIKSKEKLWKMTTCCCFFCFLWVFQAVVTGHFTVTKWDNHQKKTEIFRQTCLVFHYMFLFTFYDEQHEPSEDVSPRSKKLKITLLNTGSFCLLITQRLVRNPNPEADFQQNFNNFFQLEL